MKTLHLILKKQWFDMIESGVKKEEYRDASPYWISRLAGRDDKFIQWDAITFQHGYARNARRITMQCLGVDFGKGIYEWGAEPGKQYIVFRLGSVINK